MRQVRSISPEVPLRHLSHRDPYGTKTPRRPRATHHVAHLRKKSHCQGTYPCMIRHKGEKEWSSGWSRAMSQTLTYPDDPRLNSPGFPERAVGQDCEFIYYSYSLSSLVVRLVTCRQNHLVLVRLHLIQHNQRLIGCPASGRNLSFTLISHHLPSGV